jgi:hypothetical protein
MIISLNSYKLVNMDYVIQNIIYTLKVILLNITCLFYCIFYSIIRYNDNVDKTIVKFCVTQHQMIMEIEKKRGL